MIIVVSQWKKKVLRLITAALLILAFAAAIPVFTGQLYQRIPVVGGWFQDEQPTGNPMRVENEKQSGKYDEMMDQFVIKLQDFYYEEQE